MMAVYQPHSTGCTDGPQQYRNGRTTENRIDTARPAVDILRDKGTVGERARQVPFMKDDYEEIRRGPIKSNVYREAFRTLLRKGKQHYSTHGKNPDTRRLKVESIIKGVN